VLHKNTKVICMTFGSCDGRVQKKQKTF